MPGRITEWNFADGTSFGLYGTETADTGTSGSVMFAVADVARAVEEYKALGVHFHENGDVTDTPACQMAFGEDPEGNQFILHKRKAG
jgi:predicted enzyme related to lactoylglutathione lyase